jgi:hypothetical protein
VKDPSQVPSSLGLIKTCWREVGDGGWAVEDGGGSDRHYNGQNTQLESESLSLGSTLWHRQTQKLTTSPESSSLIHEKGIARLPNLLI